MSQSLLHNGTERPPKWHLQYIVAGVVVLEVPDSHPAPEGAVGLGSQKSKVSQKMSEDRLTKARMAITQLFCF